MEGSDSDGAVTRLHERIQRYLAIGDSKLLLDEAATRDAQTASRSQSISTIVDRSKLHWHRYLLQPDGLDRADYDEAWALFGQLLDHVASEGWAAIEPAATVPRDATWLNGLGARAMRDGRLVAAVDLFRRAESLADTHERPGFLSNLGSALHALYNHNNDLTALREAQAAHATAVALTPDGDRRAARLSNLAGTSLDLYAETGAADLLVVSVDAATEAIARTAADDPALPERLNNAAAALLRRYERDGVDSYLDEAAAVARRAVLLIDKTHYLWPSLQSNLSTSHLRRFQRHHHEADLHAAIAAAEAAVAATDHHHPEWTGHLLNLGNARHALAEVTGLAADLDEAVDILSTAAQAVPSDDSRRISILGSLGDSLRERFERSADVNDLDSAIAVLAEALDLADGRPEYPQIVSNLAAAYRARFERLGDVADIDRSIGLLREVLAAGDLDAVHRPAVLANVANVLRQRYEAFFEPTDLDAAVDYAERAVGEVAPSTLIRPHVLSTLAVSLALRFERDGDMADLDTAVALAREALQDTPSGTAPWLRRLGTLGGMLFRRHDVLREIADLNAAVALFRRAVNDTNSGAATLGTRLDNLGAALFRRFEHTGDANDLREAIRLGRQALEATSQADTRWARFAANAAEWLRLACRVFDDVDLDEARSLAAASADSALERGAERAVALSTRALIAHEQFRRSGNRVDIDAAIADGNEALSLIADQSPLAATIRINLGSSHRERFVAYGNRADIEEAMTHWRIAAATEASPPRSRLVAASALGGLAADVADWREAAAGFSHAVRLLPAVVWSGLTRATREARLAEWSALGSAAAASLLAEDRPDAAAIVVEESRSVLWTQAMELRTDLSRLAEVDEPLARRLNEIATLRGAESWSSAALGAAGALFADGPGWPPSDEPLPRPVSPTRPRA